MREREKKVVKGRKETADRETKLNTEMGGEGESIRRGEWGIVEV